MANSIANFHTAVSSMRIILLWFIFIIETISAHQIHPPQAPQFTIEPPSKVHFSNSSGTVITCTATGSPPAKIRWILADGSMANDIHGLRHVRITGELVLSPFPAEMYRQDIHSTTYRCIASNSLGTIRSRDSMVRAVVYQSYKVQVYDEFVITGNTAVMKCQVPSFVREYVKVIAWVKDDNTIATMTAQQLQISSRYVLLSSGELLIRNCSKMDIGSYRCQTRHQLTHDVILSSIAGQLIVTEPHGNIAPRIWSHSLVKGSIGESIELPCVVQSWPSSKYRWFIEEDDSGIISPVIASTHNSVVVSDGILFIKSAAVHHMGKWHCVANNSIGEEKVIIKTIVISPIVVRIEPQRMIVDIGKSATFNCSVRGNPVNYPLLWLKDGRPLITDAFSGVTPIGDGRVRLLQPTLLNIRSVVREDAGSYQCFASSDFESSQSTAELKLGDTVPIIIESFKDGITLEPGAAISLKCSASASPLPQIKWYLDDINLSLNHWARFRMGDYVTNEGRVVSFVNITNSRVADGGEYKCVALNDVGHVSFAGRVNVIGGPSIRTPWIPSGNSGAVTSAAMMHNVTVISGRSISLRCPVIAYPVESIVWQHNGNTLPVNHRQKIDPTITGIAGKLHIANVHRGSDQGEYQCTVKGSGGNGQKSKSVKSAIHLTVKVAPLIDTQPLSEKTFSNQGMKVKLICSILEGDPPIEIRWYRGTSQMPIASSHGITLQNSDDYSLLTFKSVQHKDMGNWTCKAWNDVETVNRTTFLVVNVSPSWSIEPKGVYVVLGQSASIDCSADGFPPPRIVWKKSISNGQSTGEAIGDTLSDGDHPSDFREMLSSYRHQIYSNGTFVLQEVDRSDAGFYMCQITNGIGAGLSKVIHINVQIPPYFETKFISKSATKGDTAILQCDAYGDAVMRVQWQKDKQPIDVNSDKRYAIKEEVFGPQKIVSYLEISSTGRHDSALYTCFVTNNFGSDDTNIQLIVQEVPEPPHSLSVYEITSRSATITWKSSFSGNSAIIKYVIKFRDNCTHSLKNSDKKWNEMIGTDLKQVLRPLIPVCKYEAKVIAENALGRSDPSAGISFTTGEEVPGGPPQDMVIEATSSTSLKIKWRPPKAEVQYGKIKGYYIGYKIADYDDPFQYKNVESIGDGNDETKYELSYVTNLKRKTVYVIILQAYNNIGAGPRTDEVRVVTFDSQPPTSPLLEVVTSSHDSITLRWDANDLDIEEREFILHFRDDRDTEWHQKRLKTKLNQYILDNQNGVAPIKCGTKYKLFMTATNSLGTGEPSETITTRTRGAAPVSPANNEFIIFNASSVILRLNAWHSGGCPITGFTVKYKPIYQKQWIMIGERVDYGHELFHMNDLAANREYKLMVNAHSDAGTTEAEYHFKTLNVSVINVPQSSAPSEDVASASSLSLIRNVTVLLPVIISIAVLIVVLGTLFGCMRRHNMDPVPVNCNDNYPDSHKSDITMAQRTPTESFSLNDFQCGGSKPKFIDGSQTPGIGQKNFTSGNSTSYYSSPMRKSSIIGHQSDHHEYAEPCAQRQSLINCYPFDDQLVSCGNIPPLITPVNTVQLPEKIYATIKMTPPRPFT